MLAFTLFSCWRALAADVATEPGTGTISGVVDGAAPDVWVWVEGPGPTTRASQPGRMRQSGLKFVDPVVVVVQGATVDFPNLGPEYHEVNWVAPQYSDKLGTYAPGETRSKVFGPPGTYPIGCSRHPQMSAHILVTPNDWWTQVDKAGRFTLSGVSPGEHVVVAWSPNTSTRFETKIVVVDGQVSAFNPRLDSH